MTEGQYLIAVREWKEKAVAFGVLLTQALTEERTVKSSFVELLQPKAVRLHDLWLQFSHCLPASLADEKWIRVVDAKQGHEKVIEKQDKQLRQLRTSVDAQLCDLIESLHCGGKPISARELNSKRLQFNREFEAVLGYVCLLDQKPCDENSLLCRHRKDIGEYPPQNKLCHCITKNGEIINAGTHMGCKQLSLSKQK